MSEISELLERVDMEDYLDREGIHYRKTIGHSGPQLNVKDCPVCGSSAWKVYLNADTGVGNCFAGDHPVEEKYFSKWSFIKAFMGLSGRAVFEEVKKIAESSGWKPPRKSEVVREVVSEWELPKSVALPFNGRNLPYLENRGFPGSIVEYFHWRYAHSGSYFRYKINGDWHFQDHSYRVIIPVYDLDGNLRTFQGRDITGKAEKKYLFPPGLEGSGVHLYNGFNVRNTKRVAVGEGVMDVASMKIAFDESQDLRDVVPIGTFGKHLSSGNENSQLAKFQVLKARGVEEVTIMWDGEKQALDDAVTAAELLFSIGFRTRVAFLPKDKDPNEILAQDVRAAFYKARAMNSSVDALALRIEARQY